MTPSATFWDKAAPKYAATDIADPQAYRHTLERTVAHLTPADRVLELGCGTGSTALELAPHVDEITATDVSPAMIDIAREKVAASGLPNISLLACPAGDPAAIDGAPFDVVLAFNLLHLLPNQEEVLAQIHGALKPGGLFISKTACLGERWFFKPLVGVMALIGKAPFVLHQRQNAMRDAVLAAGFDMAEELSQPGTPPRLYMVARRR